jgi:hypothetical protein
VGDFLGEQCTDATTWVTVLVFEETHDQGGSVSSEPDKISNDRAEEEHTVTEQIEIAASELVGRTNSGLR